MNCPNDNVEMHPVKIESHYGQSIILDQCESCGGIWFDESELFRAKQGESAKIELLNTEILSTPSRIDNSFRVCPRDRTRLFRFTDKHFPESIILERCPSCHGIWLNRGGFTEYQKNRPELIDRKDKNVQDKTLQQGVEVVLSAHQSGSDSDLLGNLCRFLSTDLDERAFRHQEISDRPPEEQNTIETILSVLMSLLSAFVLK